MSSPLLQSFEIARPTGRCHATGKAFEAGDPFVACLVDHAGEQRTARVDFGIDAWASGARPEPPLAVFAFWRTTMPDRDQPDRMPTGELVDVFEQLVEAELDRVGDSADGSGNSDGDGATTTSRVGGSSARGALAFLLALTLLRKKALVLDSQVPATKSSPGMLRVRRWTRAGEPHADIVEVAEPVMSEEDLAQLAESFASLIQPEGGG